MKVVGNYGPVLDGAGSAREWQQSWRQFGWLPGVGEDCFASPSDPCPNWPSKIASAAQAGKIACPRVGNDKPFRHDLSVLDGFGRRLFSHSASFSSRETPACLHHSHPSTSTLG